MIDDFFEGALDGCSAASGIVLAVAVAGLVVQLLFTPWFWALAAPSRAVVLPVAPEARCRDIAAIACRQGHASP